jgi:hypothetical protein
LTIAFFITIHYRLVQLRVADGDRVMLMATVKNTVLFIFAMIVLYGMFLTLSNCRFVVSEAHQ